MEDTSVDGVQFNPNENLPTRLRKRLNETLAHMPTCQFDVYAVLNCYFLYKFAYDLFLIKPQKKFHQLRGMDGESFDPDFGQQHVGHPKYEAATLAADLENNARNESARTQDSNARQIERTTNNRFADFSIEAYFGEAPYQRKFSKRGPAPDLVRAVVEIGDANPQATEAKTVALRNKVELQINDYMNRCQNAWKGRLWGIAIVRDYVLVITWTQPDPKSPQYSVEKWRKWEPITGAKFRDVLDAIRQWEIDHHEQDGRSSTAPREAPNAVFDLPAKLCAPLQRRFDAFQRHCPTQFSSYGPLNGWLFRRFPLRYFLVKPQPRLFDAQGLAATDGSNTSSSESSDDSTANEEHRTIDGTLELYDWNDEESVLGGGLDDAHAAPGTEGATHESASAGPRSGVCDVDLDTAATTEQPEQPDEAPSVVYPDFTVDKYTDGDDEIVLIIEVGSYNPPLSANQKESQSSATQALLQVQKQLQRYMAIAMAGGYIGDADALHGLALYGTQYLHLKAMRVFEDGTGQDVYWFTTQGSIFTKKFSRIIDKISKR